MAPDDEAEQVMSALSATLRAGMAPTSPSAARALSGPQQLQLRRRLEGGEPLGVVLPSLLALPEHERVLLEAGERSGSLPDVLDGLVAARREQKKVRRRALMALAYPLLVVMAASVLLPLPVLFTGGPGAYLAWSAPGVSVITGFVVVVFVVLPRLPPSSPLRRAGPAVLTRLPVLGSRLVYGPTATFCEVLGRSQAAGVPITAGLPSALRASGHPAFVRSADQARAVVEQGGSVDQALAEVPGLPAEVHRQIAMAEQVGKLDEVPLALAQDARERHGRALLAVVIALSLVLFFAVAALVVVGVVGAAQTFYFDRIDSLMQEMDG